MKVLAELTCLGHAEKKQLPVKIFREEENALKKLL